MSGAAQTLVARAGTPGHGTVLAAVMAASVRVGDVAGVMRVAASGRPRALKGHVRRDARDLALAALMRLHPQADPMALRQCLGFGLGDRADRMRRRLAASAWTDSDVVQVALWTSVANTAVFTARHVWPLACRVAAAEAGADADDVIHVDGRRITRPAPHRRARRWAVYLTATEGDINATALAKATGLDKKTVRHHLMQVEDEREADDALNARLDRMGQALRQALNADMAQW